MSSHITVQIIPILDDNYVFLIVRTDSNTCVVVDPGDAQPVQDYLKQQGLTLEAIVITHHHHDHVEGMPELKEYWKVPVYAPLKNKLQIPLATNYVAEGQCLNFLDGELKLDVIELPGHTLGHIAFFDKQQKWLFSGDVLFGLGCGRLFEGTFEQGYESLQRIKQLPEETLIYCTHEYTESNLQFCKKAIPSGNFKDYEDELSKKRNVGKPSIPLNLKVEKTLNPFLSAKDVEQFTEIRKLRNRGV